MDNYRFSTLAYQRPDLEARRAQLAQWKDAVEHAESYDALRSLIPTDGGDYRLSVAVISDVYAGTFIIDFSLEYSAENAFLCLGWY